MNEYRTRRPARSGFTLAELLVVIAIIAILVAIAVPVFTGSLRQAQLRTNRANMRTVKAAGVTYILENWAAEPSPMSAGAVTGWVVTARVDAGGDIHDLKVQVNTGGLKLSGISKTEPAGGEGDVMTEDEDVSLISPEYYVQVILTDMDLEMG